MNVLRCTKPAVSSEEGERYFESVPVHYATHDTCLMPGHRKLCLMPSIGTTHQMQSFENRHLDLIMPDYVWLWLCYDYDYICYVYFLSED